jgi:hypothetical protein
LSARRQASNTAYLLKESFNPLWSLGTAVLRQLAGVAQVTETEDLCKFADMIDSHWDGIALPVCKPETKSRLAFVEGHNNKIGVIQRCAYSLRERVPSSQDAHLHAADALTYPRFWLKAPTQSVKSLNSHLELPWG